MVRGSIGAWGLVVALSSATFAGESSARHKLADEVIRFLESQEVSVQTARMLTGALPDLVGQDHFPNLLSMLSRPVGARDETARKNIIRAIAATRHQEAIDVLVDLLGDWTAIRTTAQSLHDLDGAATGIQKLRGRLSYVSHEHRRQLILESLVDLGDDSQETIGSISGLRSNASRYRLYSQIRSRRVVPLLIDMFGSSGVSSADVNRALRELTLEESLAGKEQWEKWWGQEEDTFRILGSSAEDVPSLLARFFNSKDRYIHGEIKQRLESSEATAIEGLLTYLESEEGHRASIAARLLRDLGDKGKMALAEHILAGKSVPQGAGPSVAAALVTRVQTLEQVAAILAMSTLSDRIKGQFVCSMARDRQSAEYLEFYETQIPRLSPGLRAQIFTGLLEGRTAEGATLVLRAGASADPQLRAAAAEASSPGWGLDPVTAKFCAAALQEPDLTEEQTVFLLRGLSRQGMSPHAQAIALKLLSSENPHIRENAACTIEGGGLSPETIAKVRELIPEETNYRARQTLIRALGKTHTGEALEALSALLKAEDQTIQSTAASALMSFEHTSLEGRAGQVALDSVLRVKNGPAVSLLMWLSRVAPQDAALKFRERVENNPELVSTYLIFLFQKMDRIRSIPLLKSLLSNKNPRVRLGAAASLLLLDDDGGMAEYRKALESEDRTLRRDAVQKARLVRSDGVVRMLIERLSVEDDGQLKRSIHQTLRAVTGQDFGPEPEKWRKWLGTVE